MRSRLMTLVAALVTGAIAVTVVFLYVNRVEERSTQGLETRAVLVATRFVPAGTSGDEILGARAYEVRNVPVRYISPGAFSTPEQLGGLTLADDVAAGEQLSAQRFRANEQDAFLAQLPKGTEALSVPLDHVRGVAGHLKAGDELHVYGSMEGEIDNKTLKRAGVPSLRRVLQAGSRLTTPLLATVPVVEVAAAQEGAETGTMTVAVSPREATSIVFFSEHGQLWFALVGHNGGK